MRTYPAWLILLIACLPLQAAPPASSAGTSSQYDDNPLAPMAPKASAPRLDQDAVDLMGSPGLTAAQSKPSPSAPAPSDPSDLNDTTSTASSDIPTLQGGTSVSAPSDLINGNDQPNATQTIPIRRAHKAPDASGVATAPVQQDDLPQKNDQPPAGQPPVAASVDSPAQVETAPAVAPAPSLEMKLRLNDLNALQKAAEQAGGTLQITVQTVGVNPEDLILPLRKQGHFNVVVNHSDFVVSSKQDSLGQIDSLVERRRQLLQEISELDGELSQKKTVLAAGASATVATPSNLPATSDTTNDANSPDTKPAELILSTSK